MFFNLYFFQVMSVKAIGIAIKLTLEGLNQAKYIETWIFAMVALTCVITQLNYLNMVSVLWYTYLLLWKFLFIIERHKQYFSAPIKKNTVF